ncbi:hypothetical protein VIGAN_06099000 [Vigna angularis var. angularis]|uniref:Uncharacterized protein n=1 Tax=Vigna angularis var. angularis TaxID=157739 RepID=A0A0S3RES0_PHAAN|nr:hypothetical protein VIGAN_02201900 [Vigna angularis var. angularis]BAT89873.1 hypothetical protein VIGAN_06099000 [Vigna angularis var. angularis]
MHVATSHEACFPHFPYATHSAMALLYFEVHFTCFHVEPKPHREPSSFVAHSPCFPREKCNSRSLVFSTCN